ncbi:DUF11 domain-containing protein [Allorhizocola rhizosphaerae]|uniref:DUF11 domain-containing protein n=1 Tax=Allorhizocola rhizosphaerae TaxID=1872709 RepID=UPI000E3C9910|nr:DUF11 domain-containing protein [Allorhizocola rhizosphaerae]
MIDFIRVARRLAIAASLVAGVVPAGASGADLAVDLRARDGILLTSIRYDVSITNRGPHSLTSATVTVRLDSHAAGVLGSPCTFDAAADAMTCSFGSLAVNATATVGGWVLFGDTLPPGPVVATATRTASSPSDPNAANDSDTATCRYVPNNQPLDPPPEMFC